MSRRLGMMLAGLVLVCNLPCLALLSGMESETADAGSPIEWPDTARQWKSHPHYQRAQEEIAAVASRSEDELIGALDRQWVVFSSGAGPGARLVPELDFDYVLADRNIRRLDDLLARYPAVERRQRIEQLFQMAIERQIALYEEALGSLDKPAPVYENNADIPKPRPTTGRKIAVCGTVFLAAKYCGVETVDRMMNRIFDYSAALPARLDEKPYADDSVKSAMPESFIPDPNFVLNVFIFAVDRDSTFDPRKRRELKESILRSQRARLLKIEEIELGKWNAEIDWFDLRPLKAGPSMLDRRGGIDVIRSLRWVGPKEKRGELIDSMRRIVARRP